MTKRVMTVSTSITLGQKRQFRLLVEAAASQAVELALRQVKFDKDGLQKLLERGDEFRSSLLAHIVAESRKLSVANQFANEEVASTYGYLSGYSKPKGMTEQTNILRQLIPGVGYADEQLAQRPLPPNAEGYFAIPKWQEVASTYGEAVQKVLDLLAKQRNDKFHNYRQGQLGPQYLRQSTKTELVFQKLSEEQKDYDILVVPAQFGLLHRGRSVRRAREVMNSLECGLGAFAVGIMLLAHPERMQQYDDLWIDCAGDEFSVDGGGQFEYAPCFHFGDGRLQFGARWVSDPSVYFGSSSAFFPQ